METLLLPQRLSLTTFCQQPCTLCCPLVTMLLLPNVHALLLVFCLLLFWLLLFWLLLPWQLCLFIHLTAAVLFVFLLLAVLLLLLALTCPIRLLLLILLALMCSILPHLAILLFLVGLPITFRVFLVVVTIVLIFLVLRRRRSNGNLCVFVCMCVFYWLCSPEHGLGEFALISLDRSL